VTLVRAGALKERIASIIKAKGISELVIANVVVTSLTYFHPDAAGDMFLRNVASNKSHTASLPRRRYSSQSLP
jgi:hypothetical protein